MHRDRSIGPTPPEVRLAKMRQNNVPIPTPQQERSIEKATPSETPVKIEKPFEILVWGHTWTHTPNPFAEKALGIMGEKTGAFRAVISDDPGLLLPERIERFDALVMNNIHERAPFLPEDFADLDDEGRRTALEFDRSVKESILAFVRDGGGLVGIHAATAAFQDWLEYGEMIGGFYAGQILQDVVIRVEDPDHPVNACFKERTWKVHDEVYAFGGAYSREKVHVLLSLDLERMPDPKLRPDRDYPVSWVKRYGEGRVFYTTLGHCEEMYWNPLFLGHLLNGILFVCGAFHS